jgi:hypothetical protein
LTAEEEVATGYFCMPNTAAQPLVKNPKPWVAHFASFTGRNAETANFRHFRRLARSLQNGLHGWRDRPAANSGRHTMTYSTFSRFAATVIAALATTTLFISAAVGPAVQIV